MTSIVPTSPSATSTNKTQMQLLALPPPQEQQNQQQSVQQAVTTQMQANNGGRCASLLKRRSPENTPMLQLRSIHSSPSSLSSSHHRHHHLQGASQGSPVLSQCCINTTNHSSSQQQTTLHIPSLPFSWKHTTSASAPVTPTTKRDSSNSQTTAAASSSCRNKIRARVLQRREGVRKATLLSTHQTPQQQAHRANSPAVPQQHPALTENSPPTPQLTPSPQKMTLAKNAAQSTWNWNEHRQQTNRKQQQQEPFSTTTNFYHSTQKVNTKTQQIPISPSSSSQQHMKRTLSSDHYDQHDNKNKDRKNDEKNEENDLDNSSRGEEQQQQQQVTRSMTLSQPPCATGNRNNDDNNNENENENDWNFVLRQQLMQQQVQESNHQETTSSSSSSQPLAPQPSSQSLPSQERKDTEIKCNMTMIKFKGDGGDGGGGGGKAKDKAEEDYCGDEEAVVAISPNKKQKVDWNNTNNSSSGEWEEMSVRNLLYREPYVRCKQIVEWRCSFNVSTTTGSSGRSSNRGQVTAVGEAKEEESSGGTFFQFLSELLQNVCEQKLRALTISHNQLQRLQFCRSDTLPAFVNCRDSVISLRSSTQFSALRLLSLSHNFLTELPQGFWQCFSQLEVLDLSHNRLEELNYSASASGGEDESCVQHLKVLNLSHNKLQRLSDNFFHDLFPYLLDEEQQEESEDEEPQEQTNENHNERQDVTIRRTGRSRSSKLRELNLSNNQLVELPSLFVRSGAHAGSKSRRVPTRSRPANTSVDKNLKEKSKQCHIRVIDFQLNQLRQVPSLSILEQLSELGLQKFDIRFNLFDSDQVNWTVMPSHVKQLLVCLQDTFPVEVIPNLYVGGIQSARNYPLLKEKNIQYILNAAHREDTAHFPHLFKQVVVLTALDSNEQDMVQFFDMAHELINKAINEEKCGILVHCIAGQSRSIAIVLSYLMKYRNMAFTDALEFVQSRRRVAQPNTAFQIQLMEYEQTLRQSLSPPSRQQQELVPEHNGHVRTSGEV